MKLAALDLVVPQDHLQKLREDPGSTLKEHFAARRRRSEDEITTPFSLCTEVAIENVVDRVHGLRAAPKRQDGRVRLCGIIAIWKDGLVLNRRTTRRLRPLDHFRPERLAQ